jgi:hypothetical protein
MSEGGGAVRFEPVVMAKSAFRLSRLASAVGDAGSAVERLPQGGVPPDLTTQVRLELYDAGNELNAVFLAVDDDARRIVGVAAKAALADGGEELRRFAVELSHLPKEFAERVREFGHELGHPGNWDFAALYLGLREQREKYLKASSALKSLEDADEYYKEHSWARRMFRSAEDLQESLGLLKKAESIRKLPFLRPIPGVGDALNLTAGLTEGRSGPDAVEKTAVQKAAAAGGAAAGAAVCGAATGATGGLAIASCPLLVGGGAVVGDYLGGKAYDPIIKPALKIITAPQRAVLKAGAGGAKKVIHFVGRFL